MQSNASHTFVDPGRIGYVCYLENAAQSCGQRAHYRPEQRADQRQGIDDTLNRKVLTKLIINHDEEQEQMFLAGCRVIPAACSLALLLGLASTLLLHLPPACLPASPLTRPPVWPDPLPGLPSHTTIISPRAGAGAPGSCFSCSCSLDVICCST